MQILQIKDFEEKGMSEILKKSSKTGDQFTAISDLQNNEERVLFQAGNDNSVESFQRNFDDNNNNNNNTFASALVPELTAQLCMYVCMFLPN